MTCPPNVQCNLNDVQVTNAFLASPPYIADQILDLSMKYPSFMADLPAFEEFPLGVGTQYTQIVFRSEMPQIERGFANWKTLSDNTGCAPCAGPDCSYNISPLGGTGFDRRAARIMTRDYQSPSYCIKEIQTTFQFEAVMAKVIENLYAQIRFIKEQNVIFNAFTEMLKKYVVDSEGAKPNPENPYVYRRKGTATLSALNINILEFFYEQMRRDPSAIPYDVVDGSPIYSLMCSHQLLARLYRDDPQLRQDVRFSGLANDNLLKYNFMSTIRGMFIAAPILYPRRFNADAVTGVFTEVLPYVNGIPMAVGSYTGQNPAYELAQYEEVILHGKFPFKLLYMPTAATLGQNTSFGPEVSWLDNLIWVNPQTNTDPLRRVGYFFTTATIGIAPEFSDAMYGILVERPSVKLMFAQNPQPSCPVTPEDCGNTVPAVLCPCPLILSYFVNQIDDSVIIELAVPITAEAEDEIQFGISTGGYIVGTVVAISSDGKTVQVTFPDGTDVSCDQFTTIFCDNTMGCYADVVQYSVVCTDNTRLSLVLSNPVKGDVGDTITVYYGDETSASVTIVSQDYSTNTLVVDVGGTAFCDQVCGVVAVCVPTAADSTCGSCDNSPSFTQCET